MAHDVVKTSDRKHSKSLITSSPLKDYSVVLAAKTIVVQPAQMKASPVKSYLRTKVSPRASHDSRTAITIPRLALTATRVRSRKGRQATCTAEPVAMKKKPTQKRH